MNSEEWTVLGIILLTVIVGAVAAQLLHTRVSSSMPEQEPEPQPHPFDLLLSGN